jgi:Zn-dependent peptidase ImmA (M78 family)
MLRQDQIELRADRMLRDHNAYRTPVPINVLARRLGLRVESEVLGDGVSGLLVADNGRGAIAYNSAHAPVRQRFTVAHEIAHYVLHVRRDQPSQLFIDRHIFRRNEQSSTGSDVQEVEANRLAAALLMPAELVRAEIGNHSLDLDDENAVSFLAKRFHVSAQAMTNRLITLRYLVAQD